VTAALVVVDEETEPTWEPEAGYGLRMRRDRRRTVGCHVCGRPIYGDGRHCLSYVNAAAPHGCAIWAFYILADLNV
jgi:hypothetical protein